MTEPPPHKRFQIHLSTAIVMMFVAGGLMWAFVNPDIEVTKLDVNWKCRILRYGRPFQFAQHYVVYLPNAKIEITRESSWKYTWFYAILDFAIVLSLFVLGWCGCEYLIRRRAARKGA